MSSVDRFNRTLAVRYNAFKRCRDAVLSSFAKGESLDERVARASQLVDAGHDLHQLLADSDRPQWVDQITNQARVFIQAKNAEQAEQFLAVVIKSYHAIAPIDIAVDSPSYDFDAIYRRLRDDGQLGRLFEDMIAAIETMIGTGEIDSAAVLAALTRLLAILKANRQGSFVAVTGSLSYARFVSNLAIEFLKKIPGVAEFANAYEKTLAQAEAERQNIEQQLRDQSISLILDEKMRAKLQLLPSSDALLLGSSSRTQSG